VTVMGKPKRKKWRQLKEEILSEHPSQDTSFRFEVDALLRRWGFEVSSRKGKVTMWKREGDLFTQDQAEELVPRTALADAEMLDTLYWEGWGSIGEGDEIQ
jgi:hypothetical protein